MGDDEQPQTPTSRTIELRLLDFLLNHYPHMEARVGRLEGKIHVLIGLGGVALAGIITLLIRAW